MARLIDRLLASEHFGERMALYWLDLEFAMRTREATTATIIAMSIRFAIT